MEYEITMALHLLDVGIFAKNLTLPFVPTIGMRLWWREVEYVNWIDGVFEVGVKCTDDDVASNGDRLRLAGWQFFSSGDEEATPPDHKFGVAKWEAAR